MVSLNKLSMGMLNDTHATAQKLKNIDAADYVALNLNDIISVDLPDNQYFREQTNKNQIVIHHTVSGEGVEGDIMWWRQTVERIGTAIIVGFDGKIYQCFSTKYWSHHLGTRAVNNLALNKGSIGIEIDSWGGLMKYRNQWYPAKWNAELKKNVPNLAVKSVKNVYEIPEGYRGFYGYEKYTDAQIDAVRKLLVFWGDKYGIPLNYNADMFDVSNDALAGKSGIWSHSSFVTTKSDIYPDERLIAMLKSLT